jgi:predicted alpha/beta hydrolase family esterase
MTVRVLILPGLFDSGETHWQSHWERQFPDLHRVKQQDWETPTAEDWILRLNQEIAAADTPVVLVAHSLACTLITHWAQQNPAATRVRGALLVAPSDTEADSYPSAPLALRPCRRNPCRSPASSSPAPTTRTSPQTEPKPSPRPGAATWSGSKTPATSTARADTAPGLRV